LEITVARHHFPLALLRYNGIKEQSIQGVVLPRIPGHNNKFKSFYTPLSKAVAHGFGINEAVDQFTSDPRHKHYQCYVQAPLAPLSVVKEEINSLIPSSRCDRAIRLQERKESIVAPPSSASKSDDDHLNFFISTPQWHRPRLPEPIAPNRSLNTGSNLRLCSGIQDVELNTFAEASYTNRGLCASLYSYNSSTSTWHSPQCTVTVHVEENKCCAACFASAQNVHLTLPQIKGDGQWEYKSIVLPTEQLHALV
jgi:hypothetical protein